VIIVGAGPAGLRCAQVLSTSGLKVIILEKDDEDFGDKVCAGGVTRKGMQILGFPDEIIEHKVTSTGGFSRKRESSADAPEPIVFTLKRKDLTHWQKSLLDDSPVVFRKNAKVSSITDDKVIVNDDEELGYTYLVGADGYNSVVRKYLGIPVEKKLIGIQYTVPDPGLVPRLEIHLNSKYFRAWYGWIFPHKDSFATGCVCDPDMMSPKKLKENFHAWLEEKGIDVSNAIYQSAPISYDYRGLQFGTTFLVGDAGGFASGLTGEGIYQGLISGEAAANLILDENHVSEDLKIVIRYNSIQKKIMRFLHRSGILRGYIQELIVILLNNKRIKAKINKSFS